MARRISLRTTVPSQLSTGNARQVPSRRYCAAFLSSWLGVALCVTALTRTASADPITLIFSDSIFCPITQVCDPIWFGADQPFLQVGETSGGSGEIAVLSGPNASYAISNGFLGFSTAPAYFTNTWQEGPETDYQDDFGAGGGFSVTGSVFGIPPGSTLISGDFLGMICAGYDGPLNFYDNCGSYIRVSYINAAILQGFGLPTNLSFAGTLDGTTIFDGYNGLSSFDEISITSTPEPTTLVLAGWGLILIALPLRMTR